MPKLSVITINFNNLPGLEKTIESVLSQKEGNATEFIVIDGGSSDGSKELLLNYSSRLTKWVSEADKGIYDAQNKGTAMASGEYLLFLNSGDTFYSKEVLKELLAAMESGAAIIYGNSEILQHGNTSLLVPPSVITPSFWYRNTLNHQAVLIQKSVFEKFGPYRLQYRICADFDLLLRVFMAAPESFMYVACTICRYDQSGFSARPENFDEMIREKEAILRSVLSPEMYNKVRNDYRKTLRWKERFRHYMYERNWTKKLFLFVHGILFNQKMSNG